MILEEETGLLMKDMKENGDRLVVAKGGRGGKGNVHFKSPVRQAPNFAESGGFAKKRNVILELKLLADVGLVGFPNVGKSTLLSISTGANPKIANYHFTTIDPNLGVVNLFDSSFVMADIAGIIEGAHQGLGLGFQFLKHIERTKVLIHMVDVSGSEGREPIEDFEKINKELLEYNPNILKKPQIVAANKMDLLGDDLTKYNEFKEYVNSKGYDVFPLSAATKEGVEALLSEALNRLDTIVEEPEEDIEMFDFEMDSYDPHYKVITGSYDEKGKAYVLEGKQLLKIFNSTNFNDMGSLRYLYKYIEKNGAIEKLKKLGLRDGDTVRIEKYEFEYIDD
jgi:GTP-binding protein